MANSSSTPCGATNATSSWRIPLLAYRPTTLPIDTPFSTSTTTDSTPAVTPPANVAKVTCTLLAMIPDAMTGRNSWGSSM